MATLDELADTLERLARGSGRPSLDASAAFWRAQEAAEDRLASDTASDGSAELEVIRLQGRRARRTATGRLKVAAAVAAALIVIAGVFVATRDDEKGGIETITPPDEEPVGTSTTVTTTTRTLPVDPWAFEVDLIEVGGLWSVDADETTAWGVQIEDIGIPSADGDELFKVDLATSAIVETLRVAAGAVFVAAADDAVWLGHADGTVARVDPETGIVVASVDVGGSPHWIDVGTESVWVAVNNGGPRVFAEGDPPGGRVVRIDPMANAVRGEIEIETGSVNLAMAGAGGVWVWNAVDNTAIRIDPETEGVVATVDLQASGLGFGVGPDAVWRAAGGLGEPGVVTRIDPATNSIGVSIPIEAPDGSSTRPLGAEVVEGSVWVTFNYACDGGDCSIGLARIDPETSTVVATESLPADSGSVIRVGPTTVWVAGDGQLARVDL